MCKTVVLFYLIISFSFFGIFARTTNHLLTEDPPKIKGNVVLRFEMSPIGQILTNLCLGTPRQCFLFKIATNINESFIFDSVLKSDGFESEHSSSLTVNTNIGEIFFEHAYSTYEGLVAKDVLTIPESTVVLPEFTFFLVMKGESVPNYAGVLGLGKNYQDNEYSFLSMLYQNNYIQAQTFKISYASFENGGTLFFGYLDTTNPKKYKYCEVIGGTDDPTFDTTLDAIIYINNNDSENVQVYHSPQKLFFSPGANKIYCPAKFFYFFVEKAFSEYINKNVLCHTEEEADLFATVICSDLILNKELGELRFVFGKWNVSISIADLFVKCGDNEYCFEIVMANEESKWVFGSPFLKKFPVFFDGDNSIIKLQMS